MEPTELLEALLELSREFDLEVRVLRRGSGEGSGEFAPTSSVGRLHGKTQAFLVPHEPAEAHCRVLAKALISLAGSELEARFLPPAVRQCLEAAAAAP